MSSASDDWRVARSVVSYLLLFILISGLAGTVDHSEFRKQFRERRAISIGFFGQFVMLPFLGFCAVKAFSLTSLGRPSAAEREADALDALTASQANEAYIPPDYVVGIEAVILLLTTSSPGGSYSNWWCFLFNADLALSVAMTTVSSIASVVMLPLNLAIYLNATNSEGIDIEYGPLSIAVAVVVIGIAAGLAASAKFPTQRHIFHSAANVAGLSLIALGLVSTSGSRDGLFSQPWTFFAGVAAPCVVGIACSFALSTAAGLTKPQVTAVGIETVYQNTALALSVALASPAPARAAAVPVFYQGVQVVTLFVYSVACWKLGWTFAPSDASFWRMLATNYQPVFQKDVALVERELARTRAAVKEAEQEAEALGLTRKKRGLISPGGSRKGGVAALRALGLANGGSGAPNGSQPREPPARSASARGDGRRRGRGFSGDARDRGGGVRVRGAAQASRVDARRLQRRRPGVGPRRDRERGGGGGGAAGKERIRGGDGVGRGQSSGLRGSSERGRRGVGDGRGRFRDPPEDPREGARGARDSTRAAVDAENLVLGFRRRPAGIRERARLGRRARGGVHSEQDVADVRAERPGVREEHPDELAAADAAGGDSESGGGFRPARWGEQGRPGAERKRLKTRRGDEYYRTRARGNDATRGGVRDVGFITRTCSFIDEEPTP